MNERAGGEPRAVRGTGGRAQRAGRVRKRTRVRKQRVVGSASIEAPPGVLPPPTLPAGRYVELPGRGSIFVREVAGPPGAPVLLLLHGFIASGGLNWQHAFAPLSRHFRVLAPDLRGHAHGMRSWQSSFSFDACADDLAALLDALEIDSAIAAGYSMGGPIAKLLWRRSPARVAGLVLCATAPCTVRGGRLGAALGTPALAAVAATARIGQLATGLPTQLRRLLVEWAGGEGKADAITVRWALHEMSLHDPRMLMEAAAELQRFDALDWYRTIDVPTACVVTMQDTTIAPENQMLSALNIRKASVYCVDLGHVAHADPKFLRALVRACNDVAVRAATAKSPRRRARIRHGVEAHLDAVFA